MRDELIERIRPFCDRYGDKFLELMDICRVTNLRDVPDQDGLYFLKNSKGAIPIDPFGSSLSGIRAASRNGSVLFTGSLRSHP